jgi:hypothetical protein
MPEFRILQRNTTHSNQNDQPGACLDRVAKILWMRLLVVNMAVTDASPMATVEAVQFAPGKGAGPDQVHLLIDVLAKISYIQDPTSVVQVRVDQICSEAFEHG